MPQQLTRRALLAASSFGSLAPARQPSGFFRVGRIAGHWWFLDPAGNPFFSIAMNHIDSATLRYAENVDIWRQRYANSEERWIREGVAPNLRRWGFNSVGWSQEVVVRRPSIHRHSRAWSFEHYQWLNMPYCHLIPFAETHQWDVETRHPDFFSAGFEEWCDYAARDCCQRMRDDPKLIGYFYTDCPTWVHPGLSKWRGPIFDPAKLESQTGRDELFALASRYYKVTHDAIRRYDPNHLILGDRYEALQPIPSEVLRAAAPFVDVMSFQFFGPPEKVAPGLARFHSQTGKPVLLADASIPGMQNNPPERWGPLYAGMLSALRELEGCIGWHVCGAYQRNRSRGRGFLDERGEIHSQFAAAVKRANDESTAWTRKFTTGLHAPK
jgi:hypothetical protein